MGVTFSITQSPGSRNLWLYPNGNYHSGCTAVGAVSNYLCVDESYDVPDDDTTYNWAINSSVVTDMYTLENHTSETGTVNYVKVFVRAKSDTYVFSPSGQYKILAYHSGTTAISDNCNLLTDYNYFSYLLTSTPSGAAWNWTAIDNLRIGFECNSPPTGESTQYLVLRPTSDEALELQPNVGLINYTQVDEDVADGNTTYVLNMTAAADSRRDLYGLQNHTTETGTINNITVYNTCKRDAAGDKSYEMMKTGGTEYTSSAHDLTTVWTEYHTTWTSVPSTSVAWTWAEIDNLQAGVKLYNLAYGRYPQCTQVYVVVSHQVTDISPEIHTTQCYAVVNYTASSATCFLNQPTRYGISNTRKVGIVQPERGDRVVYDLCRESKILTMEGIEFDTTTSTATTRLLCVRNMKDNGTYITIEDIDTKVDTTWLITDFNYDRDENNPSLWNWFLTAEKYEDG